ncbi:MAG: hypothetical protein JST20_01605 [Bacteroidetes bacterium]|nr:hypothetical protein [Bacteroidota bacterium]
MEHSELLYDFMDGTTNAVQEQTLFMALASQEELRADLKELLAIKTAVQNDSKAYNPPVESTLALFSTLGFAAPQMPVIPKAGVFSRASTFIGSSSKAILTGLAMSSVTAVAMFLLMNNKAVNDTVSAADKVNATSTSIAEMSNSNSLSTPIEIIKTVKVPPKEIIKYVYITVPEHQSAAVVTPSEIPVATSISLSETNEKSSPAIIDADYHTPTISQNSMRNSSKWKSVDYDASQLPNAIDNPSPSSISRWTLELRRIDTRSTIEPTFISQTPLLNNLAVTALYSLSSEFAAGIEVANEQSFQRFTSKDNAGRTLLYEQNPTLPSVAATLRYSPFEWGKFQPIIQASIGGTEVGPFGRGLIGVQYFPETFISFIIGAEANMLSYSHQNTNYTTSKYGLNYGISFHF